MSTKKIGFWSSTSLVVGNMIGSGVFLLPASLAAYGAISIIGWICASLGAILLAIIFGNLGKLAPETTGGPYAYTRLGLGRFPAYLVAWGYWISIWCTNAAIAVALVGYLEVFFPILGKNQLFAVFTGLGFIWVFTWVNSKPIKTVAFVQLITTILKVVPIILIGFIGIAYIKVDHFTPFNLSGTSSLSAITATTTLTLFAFLGMETATIPSSSIKNAATTIKKATVFGTLITIIVYILSSVAIMGIIPPDILATSTAPFADAAALFWGTSAKYIVAGGAVIATLGALNGWILIQGQIPMAASQDQLFPKIFGKVNSNKSPILGIVLSSILASILMGLNYTKSLVDAFTFMMKLSTLSVLTPYILSTLSLLILLRKKEGSIPVSKQILSGVSMLFCIWVIIGCGAETILWGLVLLLIGIPFYLYLTKKVLKFRDMEHFYIHPDITKAETLPASFYRSQDVFDAIKERIFETTWQWIGDANSCIPLTESVFPFVLLDNYLTEPMMVVRDKENKISCLSNVCTHRGNIVAHHPGKIKNFTCMYHGRRFDLQGTFKSMPEFEKAKDFPRPCDSLHKFELREWGSHLFVGLHPIFDFSEVINVMKERVGFLPLNEFKLDTSRNKDYIVNCHWALYCDNYLEGFHIPFVHADLNEALDYGQYKTEIYDHVNLQIGYSDGGDEVFALPEGHPDHGKHVAAYYYWVFPNMMFNFYPWGLSVNIVKPFSLNKTKVSFITYVYDETKLHTGAGALLDKVEREDEFVVEGVHKGLQSKFYKAGRFSPTREKGVHHFHSLLAKYLNT